MKPLLLPDSITRPRTLGSSGAVSSCSSSSSVSCESVLTLLSALSNVSQQMPSSTRRRQCRECFMRVASCGLRLALDLEIADQRQVVGEADRRNRKIRHVDPVAVEHEVELLA